MKEKGDRRRVGKKRWHVCDCELLPTRELRLWFEGTRSVSLRNMLSVENKRKIKCKVVNLIVWTWVVVRG